MSKIVKPKGTSGKSVAPSELELRVATEFANLQKAEANNDIKATLEQLYFVGAQQIKLDSGKEAIVITVPYKLLKLYHQVQSRLVRELEKKFSGHHVVIVAARKIVPLKGLGPGQEYCASPQPDLDGRARGQSAVTLCIRQRLWASALAS